VYILFWPLLPNHCRCRGLLLRLSTRNDTSTLSRTLSDDGSDRRRDLYLTTHETHNRQTSMLPAAFEPAFPVSQRRQTYT